jgi:NAD(P)-dependent dehydrogenase (short-subunit alcohol dehydrogenase family)
LERRAAGGRARRASKAGLNIINKALVLDLAEQQVQCVLMHPGYVRTDLTGGPPPGSTGGLGHLLVSCPSRQHYHAGRHAGRGSEECCTLVMPASLTACWSCRADGNGWIDVDESTDGIMSVLESGRELNGRFYGYDGAEIPW